MIQFSKHQAQTHTRKVISREINKLDGMEFFIIELRASAMLIQELNWKEQKVKRQDSGNACAILEIEIAHKSVNNKIISDCGSKTICLHA